MYAKIKTDKQEKKKEVYKQYLEKHMTVKHLASQSYDKAILTLSIAALGFTFAYINFASTTTSYGCFLVFTWVFLIIFIVLVLISFVLEQSHCVHKIKHCLFKLLKEGGKVDWKHWSDPWMIRISVLAGVCFTIGIVLFTMFVGLNMG